MAEMRENNAAFRFLVYVGAALAGLGLLLGLIAKGSADRAEAIAALPLPGFPDGDTSGVSYAFPIGCFVVAGVGAVLLIIAISIRAAKN